MLITFLGTSEAGTQENKWANTLKSKEQSCVSDNMVSLIKKPKRQRKT